MKSCGGLSRVLRKLPREWLPCLVPTIETFEGREDGTLTLNFSNGHRLMIPDSSQEYESYSITRPGITIVL
jgi:Family of unknown function (DUF6188)